MHEWQEPILTRGMQQLQIDETRLVVWMPWHLHVPPTHDESKMGRNPPRGDSGARVGHGPTRAPEVRQSFGYRNAVFISAYEMVEKGQEPGKSYGQQHTAIGSLLN